MIEKNKSYFEIFILFISISFVLNAIPEIIIQGWRFNKYWIIGFLILIYLIVEKKIKILGLGRDSIVLIGFSPLFIAIFSELFRPIFKSTKGYNPFYTLLISLFLIIFLIFLFNIFSKKIKKIGVLKSIIWGLKPLFYYSIYIIISSILIYFLGFFELIDFNNWELPNYFGDDFSKRLDPGYAHFETNYYLNPLRLIVLMPNYIKVGNFLGNFGSFCGLSYEPHIAMFFITPCFFISKWFIKSPKKLFFYRTGFLFTALLSASIVNIFSIFLVLLTYYLIKLFSVKRIFFFFIFILIFISIYSNLYNLITDIEFISSKLRPGNVSAGVSFGYMNYILSPSTFIGDGFFIVPDYRSNFKFWDFGLLYSLLYVFQYLILIFSSILLMKSKKFNFLGAASLYVSLHILKFPLHAIIYPFTWFFLFLNLLCLSQLILKKNVFQRT